MKKIALFFLGALALYLIFFKPAQALKEANMYDVYDMCNIAGLMFMRKHPLFRLLKNLKKY